MHSRPPKEPAEPLIARAPGRWGPWITQLTVLPHNFCQPRSLEAWTCCHPKAMSTLLGTGQLGVCFLHDLPSKGRIGVQDRHV